MKILNDYNDEDDNDGGEDNISGKIYPPEQGVHP